MGKVGQGFVHAWHGVLYVFEHERNARIHLLFAVGAFCVGVYLHVSDTQLTAIFFAVILVFLAEIFNTAIEKVLDLLHPDINPKVRIIKDMAAGGVLVAAVAAGTIGVVIFAPYVVRLLWLV
jgi:diacylglycerol kinase